MSTGRDVAFAVQSLARELVLQFGEFPNRDRGDRVRAARDVLAEHIDKAIDAKIDAALFVQSSTPQGDGDAGDTGETGCLSEIATDGPTQENRPSFGQALNGAERPFEYNGIVRCRWAMKDGRGVVRHCELGDGHENEHQSVLVPGMWRYWANDSAGAFVVPPDVEQFLQSQGMLPAIDDDAGWARLMRGLSPEIRFSVLKMQNGALRAEIAKLRTRLTYPSR